MTNLIRAITKNSTVVVKGQPYKPIGKATYVTQSAPQTRYVKVFMEGHFALVISPDDNFMYFGRDLGNIGDGLPSTQEFTYTGETYKKTAEDYQIVISLNFGDPNLIEGEVVFWDFESVENPDHVISLGLVQRTKQRADIVAEVLREEDVSVQQHFVRPRSGS